MADAFHHPSTDVVGNHLVDHSILPRSAEERSRARFFASGTIWAG
jgi:hypothetical protein